MLLYGYNGISLITLPLTITVLYVCYITFVLQNEFYIWKFYSIMYTNIFCGLFWKLTKKHIISIIFTWATKVFLLDMLWGLVLVGAQGVLVSSFSKSLVGSILLSVCLFMFTFFQPHVFVVCEGVGLWSDRTGRTL